MVLLRRAELAKVPPASSRWKASGGWRPATGDTPEAFTLLTTELLPTLPGGSLAVEQVR